MTTNIHELKAQCKRFDMTLNELADALGISSTTLYRKMAGKTEFSLGELQLIKSKLQLDDETFLAIFFA